MSGIASGEITAGTGTSIISISDLFEKAAKELRQLNAKKEEVIQNLAKEVEQRGVPKNRVARIVVKELSSRGALLRKGSYEI